MFSAMTLQNDPITVTLDGSGVSLLDPYGVRWCDLSDSQYSRMHVGFEVNTVGASASISGLAYVYSAQGVLQFALATSSTATVYQTDGAALTLGPWFTIPAQIVSAGDMEIHVRVAGTPNASVTVNFADIQFR